jgi:peroxiredoxin Q/BCP
MAMAYPRGMLSLLLAAALILPASSSPALVRGERAPSFVTADSAGQSVSLTELLQHGPVVLAFFPKAQTSGCTLEMQAFVRAADTLARHHAQVLAISGDSAADLQAFRQAVNAQFTFVPDTSGALMALYQAKMPFVAIAKRRTFIVGRDGRIAHIVEGKDAIALTGIEAALMALDQAS